MSALQPEPCPKASVSMLSGTINSLNRILVSYPEQTNHVVDVAQAFRALLKVTRVAVQGFGGMNHDPGGNCCN